MFSISGKSVASRLLRLRWSQTSSLSSSSSSSSSPCSTSLSSVARRLLSSTAASRDPFRALDEFAPRHLGPRDSDIDEMLAVTGFKTLDELALSTVPESIRFTEPLDLPAPLSESEALAKIRAMANKNKDVKSFIGMGYYGTHTPGVILRNMLENPGFYTSYTPYQPEISQGRLECLLNFQTMVSDLTGLDIANASLLDEATAAAEAMNLCIGSSKRHKFFVADDCHPQTIAVVQTRAKATGVEVVVGPPSLTAVDDTFAGALFQYPNTYGHIGGLEALIKNAHDNGAMVAVASDLLALCALKSPGEMGADVVVGSAQRFGVPMGFGGPHAGFFATKEEHMRKMPGRVIGVSRDSNGNQALRMAMQTREQHIRRDKATSNICTAQALLANMAGAYGLYHGPNGLRRIANRVHLMASTFAKALEAKGCNPNDGHKFFDTVTVDVSPLGLDSETAAANAVKLGYNIRVVDAHTIGISFDETATRQDLTNLLTALGVDADVDALAAATSPEDSLGDMIRTSEFMTHPIFSVNRSETQMLRYLHKLQSRDISLTTSMMPLGSCTMKLNATSEMQPITWPEFANVHPFVPGDQPAGYIDLINSLHEMLCEITGFAAMSTQPNSGAQGEYAGLLAIREYHLSRGEPHRNICLIPLSAHGTNPASAVMAGMKVVTVKNDAEGDIDMADFKAKAEKHKDNLAALMITYPSTYGKFESGVKEICKTVHEYGGQVYMDGANMNAQVGLCSPGKIGADVCHLNLHKTFCIPHGGGGPGVGTIGVARHLAPFLPGHSVVPTGGEGDGVVAKTSGAVSAAPFGSALILPISWMYITMLGEPGLKKATQVAILNANYMAKRLEKHYKVLFRGENGQCAHEFIIDLRPFKKAGIVEEDVAKRLIDFGFHAPTMSWPVPGTLMIEPTESEDRAELDRFVDALILIRQEIDDVVAGRIDPKNNPLKHAPHTAATLTGEWDRPYTREQAVYPAPWLKEHKFWPVVGRLDNVYGDRHIVCSCPPLTDYE